MNITRTEIINILFEKYGFKSYLEIGVCVPAENFDKINAETKISVDPAPNGYCTYVMTSDEFFINHVGSMMFDLIFVDGMHTDEQVYRDIKNSINHLNENGVIVVHDCNPPTEYHARSYESFTKTRGQWNGTTYKGFIQSKNELNDWSCFVVNEDWGCGIITKRNFLENKQHKIDTFNMSWKDFEINRNELLQLITFEEYIKLI